MAGIHHWGQDQHNGGRMISSKVFLIATSLMLLLSGCTTPLVRSVKYPSEVSNSVSGVQYYLPKKLVKVSVDVKSVPATQVQKQLDKAFASVKVTQEYIDTCETDLASLELDAKADPNTNGISAVKAAVLKEKISNMTKKNDEAKQNVFNLSAQMSQTSSNVVDITFELLPAIPDLEHGYVLANQHNWFRSDESTFCTSPSGLLESGAFTSDDQTVAIIAKLVEAAARVAGIVSRGGSKDQQAGPSVENWPKHAEFVFDPASTGDCQKVSNLISNYTTMAFHVSTNSVLQRVIGDCKSNDKDPNSVDGILYRREIPYHLVVESPKDSICVIDQVIYIPNNGPISRVNLSAGPFVKAEHNLKFKDGMLTSVETKSPSEALGLVKTLPDSLKAIAAVPGEMLQLKIDYSSKEAELAKKQTETIKAELDQLKALQEKNESR
jgi:hypothetical protein